MAMQMDCPEWKLMSNLCFMFVFVDNVRTCTVVILIL